MKKNKRDMWCALVFILSSVLMILVVKNEIVLTVFSAEGNLVTFTGDCRFQLVQGFFSCSEKVIYMQNPNGSHLTFEKDNTLFDLSVNSDRQPDLNNYYLSIDNFGIKRDRQDWVQDQGVNGECHFSLNEGATKFYFIKCDIGNKSKGTFYNFYLEKIRTFTKKPM